MSFVTTKKIIEDEVEKIIKSEKREIKVLNLFAYTGGATVACLSAGAAVCHVDSSKGMVAWAKENVISSGLEKRPVRYIIDDVNKLNIDNNKICIINQTTLSIIDIKKSGV